MLTIIEIVLPVFLIIGLGYLICRIGLVDDHFFEQVNGLVFYICLPTLLFYKISTADFETSFNFRLVVATSLAVVCCFLITYCYGAWRNYSPPAHGSFCQGSFRGNLAYIGLAIVYNAYGDQGLTRAGILTGFLVPVFNLFAILALVLPQRQKHAKTSKIVKDIAFNPLILASLAGLVWSFFQIPMPQVMDQTLHVLAGVTLPLALLSIGNSFRLENLKGDLGKGWIATAVKLLLLPLVTVWLMGLLGVSGLDFGVGLLMAASPTAVSTYIMASKMGGDGELAGTIVILATALSAISYTLWLLYLRF